MSNWVERYRAGDRAQVWTEMTSLPAPMPPDARKQAAAVARETMRRSRANVERLLDLLPERGYAFAADRAAFVPPTPDVTVELDALEERIGRLPLALRSWFEEVGQVNFVGECAAWSYSFTDPLVVEAPAAYIHSEYDAWEADRGTEWDQGPFALPLAPDYLHKADVSGGPPYSMRIPNDGVDGLLLWERHQTTFVNYLRIAFRWGGFPGWDRGSLDGWARPDGPPPTLLDELSAALLPI